MTTRRPLLLFTLLLAGLISSVSATTVRNQCERDIEYYYSESDGIPGWRVTVDGKPCISYTLWKTLHKHFSSEVAKAICEDTPLIDYDDVDGITFAEADDCEGYEVGDLCVHVSRGEWSERIHLRCRQEYADYEIFVGHFIDKL